VTALKPIENRNVRGVASERYPINKKCAHPECSEPATVHHIFPRSMIKSDSYFVEIHTGLQEADSGPMGDADDWKDEVIVIPHAVGLCGSGTTGHHGDVEEHRAWIKYEDGEFVWYDRDESGKSEPGEPGVPAFDRLGPLNPQPGSREGKPKRKRYTGQARRQRVNWQVKVPKDAQEDGAGILDDLLEQCKDALGVEQDFPTYHTLTKVIYDWLTGGTAKDARD
jgi:hypothetical protein